MLTLREMMTALYLEGGPHCATACEWLHEADEDLETFTLIEDTLALYDAGLLDPADALAAIAKATGLVLVGGDA